MFRWIFLLLGYLTILLSGCARLPIAGPDAARLSSTAVASLDAEALFTVAPGGKQVAFSRQGVWVAALPSGESRSLSSESPLALAWSPDGTKLAAAFGHGPGSRITVFGGEGTAVAETPAAGRVAALFWSASDVLLAVSMELEHRKFGTSCREVLLRWNLAGTLQRTVLHDVTLKPYTVRKWGTEMLTKTMHPAFSPLGDELVYGRLHDPPAFEAYRKVMIRNISSGAEREIAKTALGYGTARFSTDGEELFMYDSSGQLRRIDAWSGAEKQTMEFSGRSLAVSPDGRHLLADGRLLDNGREVVLFTPWATGEFLDDGRLLVADDGTLFLVSGFESSAALPAASAGKLERLRTIRSWRSSGIISADDYVSAREKVIK